MKTQIMQKSPMNHKVLNEERENKLAKQAEERRKFRQKMQKVEKKEPIFVYCKANLFLTGSRVIGGAIESSDWDFLLLRSDLEKFITSMPWYFQLPEKPKGSLSSLFESVVLEEKGRLINLIILDTIDDYEAWVNATIKTTNDKPKTKADRKSIFGKYLLESYELFKDQSIDGLGRYNTAVKLWGNK